MDGFLFLILLALGKTCGNMVYLSISDTSKHLPSEANTSYLHSSRSCGMLFLIVWVLICRELDCDQLCPNNQVFVSEMNE